MGERELKLSASCNELRLGFANLVERPHLLALEGGVSNSNTSLNRASIHIRMVCGYGVSSKMDTKKKRACVSKRLDIGFRYGKHFMFGSRHN